MEETLVWCEQQAATFENEYRGKIDNPELTPEQLVAAIRKLEHISNELSKPLNYSHLLFSTNTGDPKLGAFLQKVQERASNIQVQVMFFELELQAAPEELISRIAAQPELENYRHWLHLVRVYTPHRLTEPEEIVLEKMSNTGGRAWVRLFEEITANHKFKVKEPNGPLKEMNAEEVLALMRDSDRTVRQAAADALTEGLKELERVLVFTYNNLLQDKKIEDELRNYSYPEESRHMANELDRESRCPEVRKGVTSM